MHKKSDFSTQGHAILFTLTTIPISPNQTLEFYNTTSNPSPFPLVATSLPFIVASCATNLSLFIVDHAHENLSPSTFESGCFFILWALSPTLEVDVLINN